MLRVAVVGSGPSGVYTAQNLVQLDSGVLVDVLDRLPCPYGLVRYGVAPDHEKIKSLQNNLRTVDFSLLLGDIMAIADEVDSQLAQAMTSYTAEANVTS